MSHAIPDPAEESSAQSASSQPKANSNPPNSTAADGFEDLETYLDYQPDREDALDAAPQAHQLKVGPLVMVETAFLASTAALIWLVNTYFPPGPILRILFPLPTALIYLRWGSRAAWMSALVTGLLLAVLMGPPRSLLFLMPYALLGVQLGYCWARGTNWYVSITLGSLLGSIGFFFRVWLTSLLVGEDLWIYVTSQVTQMLNWGIERLVNWGILSVAVLGQANVGMVQLLALLTVVLSNLVYLFTVHLAAWLLLERLGATMPAPPNWVQTLLDE